MSEPARTQPLFKLAKTLGVPNRDLVALLKEKGMPVKRAIDILTVPQVEAVLAKFAPAPGAPITALPKDFKIPEPAPEPAPAPPPPPAPAKPPAPAAPAPKPAPTAAVPPAPAAPAPVARPAPVA